MSKRIYFWLLIFFLIFFGFSGMLGMVKTHGADAERTLPKKKESILQIFTQNKQTEKKNYISQVASEQADYIASIIVLLAIPEQSRPEDEQHISWNMRKNNSNNTQLY